MIAFIMTLCLLLGTSFSWQTQQTSLQRRLFFPSHLYSFSINSIEGENVDPVIRLPLMEAELATLLATKDKHDDKERIRELKEAIKDAKTSAEFGVRRAQVKFYDAFSAGDLELMKQVWSSETDAKVRCVHPGMAGLEGIDIVMKSWEQIFSSGPSFSISPKDTRIEICGQTAICSCVEETPNGGQLEALNIYQREGGNWRMALHMASPVIMKQGSSAFF